jgi:hypothetical protein
MEMMSTTKTMLGLAMAVSLCAPILTTTVQTARAEGEKTPTMQKATNGQAFNDMKGAVVHRDGDSFTMRQMDKSEWNVLITDQTSIKTERKGLFRGSHPFDVTSIIDGLILEVEGTGDAMGNVVAKKIRFSESDLHAAITAQIHSKPIEESAAATAPT